MGLYWIHPVLPLVVPSFSFCSISWEGIDRFRPNFVCTSPLTGSILGSLPVLFPKILMGLWPLIEVRILFLLNILRMNWQNQTKFCMHIKIIRVKLWTVTCPFSQNLKELRPLILLNILKMNWQNLTKYWQDLALDWYPALFLSLWKKLRRRPIVRISDNSSFTP